MVEVTDAHSLGDCHWCGSCSLAVPLIHAPFYAVECIACGATGPEDEIPDKAIEHWLNMPLRTENALLRRERDALRSAMETIADADVRHIDTHANTGRAYTIDYCYPDETKDLARAALSSITETE